MRGHLQLCSSLLEGFCWWAAEGVNSGFAELSAGHWASLAMRLCAAWRVCRGRDFRYALCKHGGAGTLQTGREEKGFLRWFKNLPIVLVFIY